MSARNTTPESFKADYELLQLDDRADWDSARASYRRMVHLWHPDKFTQRPNEKTHAQQQFINLTKSYNSLRNFHRKHGRLPFESASARATASKGPAQARNDGRAYSDRKGKSTESGTFSWDRSGNGAYRQAFRSRRRTAWWIASGAFMMISTIAVFLVLDNNASKARMEQGREIVRQTPQSEFMPNVEGIRQTKAREKFLNLPNNR